MSGGTDTGSILVDTTNSSESNDKADYIAAGERAAQNVRGDEGLDHNISINREGVEITHHKKTSAAETSAEKDQVMPNAMSYLPDETMDEFQRLCRTRTASIWSDFLCIRKSTCPTPMESFKRRSWTESLEMRRLLATNKSRCLASLHCRGRVFPQHASLVTGVCCNSRTADQKELPGDHRCPEVKQI